MLFHFSSPGPKKIYLREKRRRKKMANYYVKASPPTDLNKNTEWFTYPGVWTTYILILFFAWLVVLSVFNCSPGMAWTIVHLSHFLVFLYRFIDHFGVFPLWVRWILILLLISGLASLICLKFWIVCCCWLLLDPGGYDKGFPQLGLGASV